MTFFHDRHDAGIRLLQRLRALRLPAAEVPLVLAIPRGGVEVGAVLAHGLGADLDVVLARKLRAPGQPELAIGAVTEDGEVELNPFGATIAGSGPDWIEAERRRQIGEIARRRAMYRAVRPPAPIAGRTVIVTDDGLATGSTMLAALRTVRAAGPARVIVALPVASPERLAEVEALCDRVECLLAPRNFLAVGGFYDAFDPVSDDRVVALLREFGRAPSPGDALPAASGA